MPIVSVNDLPKAWKDVPNLLKLPFSEILQAWDQLDNHGRYQAGVRALARFDRYYLLVKILKRLDVWHPWLYERCREVQTNPDGYLDIWSREHYKSTLITFAGVVQEILNNSEITIGIFSHTKSIAKGFLSQIQRELESNATLIGLFPDILYADPRKQSPSWSLDNGLIIRRATNPKEATVEAHGLVDGQPTGKHFQLLVYDDVVTLESVNTPEQIDKTTKAWELSDNLGIAGGRKWHIGTRYSYGDTYAIIMDRQAAIPRLHPATEDGTLSGNPVLLTPKQWRKKVNDQGEATVSSQMLCNPLAGHERMFQVEDLQVYEVRPETIRVYIMVDPARSVKKDSANTAMAVIGVDYSGNKYLLDGYDHKMDLMTRWENMRNLWVKWKSETGVQAVEVGYERYGAIADMDYFKERIQNERLPVEIKELEWPREGLGSKVDRVQRLGPDIRQHRFYLPYESKHSGLTKQQQKMRDSGYAYRIAAAIIRRDENDQVYNLAERLRMQIHYFPLGGLKDLVDATSRIYDMDVRKPVYIDQSELEPEFV